MKNIALLTLAALAGLCAVPLAQADDACPAGKEAACKEAAFQATAYNVAISSRTHGKSANMAEAKGPVFVLKIGVDTEAKADPGEEQLQASKLTNMFDKPLKAMCNSSVYNSLVNVGGAYRTQIYDRHDKLLYSIDLDCDQPLGTQATIEQQ